MFWPFKRKKDKDKNCPFCGGKTSPIRLPDRSTQNVCISCWRILASADTIPTDDALDERQSSQGK